MSFRFSESKRSPSAGSAGKPARDESSTFVFGQHERSSGDAKSGPSFSSAASSEPSRFQFGAATPSKNGPSSESPSAPASVPRMVVRAKRVAPSAVTTAAQSSGDSKRAESKRSESKAVDPLKAAWLLRSQTVTLAKAHPDTGFLSEWFLAEKEVEDLKCGICKEVLSEAVEPRSVKGATAYDVCVDLFCKRYIASCLLLFLPSLRLKCPLVWQMLAALVLHHGEMPRVPASHHDQAPRLHPRATSTWGVDTGLTPH